MKVFTSFHCLKVKVQVSDVPAAFVRDFAPGHQQRPAAKSRTNVPCPFGRAPGGERAVGN